MRPEAGSSGQAALPDGKVQHAGVVLGIGGVAGHGHNIFPATRPYYHAADSSQLQRRHGRVQLVPGTSRGAGGLDERNLAVAFNDVDFCLRARERGYLVVWSPALLTHFESESRGFD